jgi:iron-sulfur cluster repair protein YtfE (RIC family)
MITEAELGFETATEYLSWDHDRLDGLLESVRSAVERGDWVVVRRHYAEFHRGLHHHIRLEEDILFPVFEERTRLMGPTNVMREEHGLIRGALAILSGAVRRGDARGFHASLTRLLAVLPDHNAKEERVLYPATDRALSARERADLAERLEEL